LSGLASAFAVAALAAVGACGWLSARALAIARESPDRLVAELRLAQVAALLLALVAGTGLGTVVLSEASDQAAIEVPVAVGFLVIAAAATFREPHQALTLLAAGFALHAGVDALHRPGLLDATLAPRWFLLGGAIVDAALGIICYLPVLRR
jgi:hypothetical protein